MTCPPERLTDTLEGFHITPRYLRRYDEVLAKYGAAGSPDVKLLHAVCETAKRTACNVLEDARAQGQIVSSSYPWRSEGEQFHDGHGNREGRRRVDLDTVKPGLVHYDIGDCLRSGCNRLGEETEALGGRMFRHGPVPCGPAWAIFLWRESSSPGMTTPISTIRSA